MARHGLVKVYESRLERLEREVGRVMSLLPGNDPSSLASVLADSEASGAPSPNFEQSTVDNVIHDIMSVQQADLLLADYRETFAPRFPYVIIPEGVASLALQQTSPMLLLAILTTTSWKLRGQQDHLNQVFLKALGTKLVLEGDRDMDLLSGLMVYLNWIHLHTTPKTQQAYRLASIAASMAVEFGITQRPGKNKHQQLNVEAFVERPKGLSAVDAELWDPVARRAYLGCYQMTTWLSLAAAKEILSDLDLVFHLEVAREAEKAYTFFNYTDIQQTQFMGEQQIQVYLNAFSVKVQDWQLRLPSSLAQDRKYNIEDVLCSESSTNHPSACQRIWPWLLEAFVRELCLSGMARSTDFSMARIRILMDALTSTKGYFDTFLAIPSESIPSLPSTHWALLSYSILLTASISLSTQTQGWSIESARSVIKLDAYIEAISLRVKELSLGMGSSEHLRNWYGDALAGWEAIKMRYLAACQESLSQTDSYSQSATSQVSHRAVEQSDGHGPQNGPIAHLQGGPSQRDMAENSIRPITGLEAFDFSADTGLLKSKPSHHLFISMSSHNSVIVYPSVPPTEEDPRARINVMIDIFNAGLSSRAGGKLDRGLYHEIFTAYKLVQDYKIMHGSQISRPLTDSEKREGNKYRELDMVYNEDGTTYIVEAKNTKTVDHSQLQPHIHLAQQIQGALVYAIAEKDGQERALKEAHRKLQDQHQSSGTGEFPSLHVLRIPDKVSNIMSDNKPMSLLSLSSTFQVSQFNIAEVTGEFDHEERGFSLFR
ncbi:c6 zinc finger domain-containing protein [Fusarium globosum]|uniref:C6 zinc finger domain-containing protein n=1 Tax=Fusarium globosum TaxID=78864 RepID=A0A8H5YTJ4_9HYPO|nr:c6 zinc finger domain-containing protein [Fusarium globosum]